jgi:hypothetical protein
VNWCFLTSKGCGGLAHDRRIKAFSDTGGTEDPKRIAEPARFLQGDDDQIVPRDASAKLQT